MFALLFALASGAALASAADTINEWKRATDHYQESLERDPYRNHTPTDPDRLAAAIRRHNRPYLGPRNRNRA